MSIIAEVVRKLGVTREDVIRVAREGGSTSADWDIAVAIEEAGGRKAVSLMCRPNSWRAEHERLQRALWQETRPEDVDFLREKAAAAGITDITPLLPGVVEETAEAPAPTNPRAVYDPQVHVYDEPTAPDAPQTALPDHSHDDAPEATDDSEAAEELAASVHADLAAYARSKHFAARVTKKVAAAGSLAQARTTLYRELANSPVTSLFGLHPEPVALTA